jgi:hypothetical protein
MAIPLSSCHREPRSGMAIPLSSCHREPRSGVAISLSSCHREPRSGVAISLSTGSANHLQNAIFHLPFVLFRFFFKTNTPPHASPCFYQPALSAFTIFSTRHLACLV